MKMLTSITFAALLLCACKDNSRSGQIIRDGVAISFSQFGKGDTALLFIHGWGINKEYWQPQADFFSSRYKVVSVDLPGFGQSGKPGNNWSFASYTEDIKAVIEQLNLTNVIVVGHSMSGDIILDLSSRYPAQIAGIIGVDNLHEPAGTMNDRQKADADSFFSIFNRRFDSVVAVSMDPYLFQPTTPAAIKERVMKDIKATGSQTAVKVLQSLTFFAQNEQTRMQQLHHRLFLINSNVQEVRLDSLNKYCAKGAEVVYVDKTGHYPMLEKPAAFNHAMQEVLNRIARQ